MQAERRPWISIEVTGHSGIVWEERGARLSVVFKLKNVGKTPATNVFFEAKAILPKVGGPAIPTQATFDYAADIRRRRALGDIAGETYFPGDQTYPGRMEMLIDKQEFVELIKKTGMPTVLPRIIACASYSINSDKTLKQTCTSYYVML